MATAHIIFKDLKKRVEVAIFNVISDNPTIAQKLALRVYKDLCLKLEKIEKELLNGTDDQDGL